MPYDNQPEETVNGSNTVEDLPLPGENPGINPDLLVPVGPSANISYVEYPADPVDKEAMKAGMNTFAKELQAPPEALNQPARLTKRQSVLRLHEFQKHDDSRYFETIDDDTQDPETGHYMALATWEEFGKPDTITVTVRPGDLLN